MSNNWILVALPWDTTEMLPLLYVGSVSVRIVVCLYVDVRREVSNNWILVELPWDAGEMLPLLRPPLCRWCFC